MSPLTFWLIKSLKSLKLVIFVLPREKAMNSSLLSSFPSAVRWREGSNTSGSGHVTGSK